VIQTTQEPPPPVVTAPPAPPAPPRVVNVGAVCPDHVAVLGKLQLPPQLQGQSGKVLVEFLVGADGAISGVTVAKSTNRMFNNTAIAAISRLHCQGQGQSVRVQVPFVFDAEN
jgi:TonB family protein